MYVCSGCITHEIEGEALALHEGDLLMMNPWVVHSVKETGPGDVAVNFIALPEFFSGALKMLGQSNPIVEFMINALRPNRKEPQHILFRNENYKSIRNLMENLLTSISRENTADGTAQYTMGLIFLHMLEHMGNLAKTEERHFEDGIVQATLDYIDVCYQSASLTEMARRFHQPLSGLSRLIRQTTGVTFRELLMNKRFQKALVMLVETDLPVEEIAVNVGYENQSYFYRQFKKRYGVTPRSYRLLHGKPPERRKTGKPEHIAGGGFLLE